MHKILTVDSLSKHYGSVHALNGLSINVHKGDVYGVLGPNGSGKTTTLGIILGVTNASSGSYSWFEAGKSHELRKRIGALLERPAFYGHLNAIQNLRLVADIKDLKVTGIDQAMELCGVTKFARRRFRTYSTGMKQRLSLAAAMLGEPEVLVLDEPTNGLDPEGIADVRNIIAEIAARGITVIMASHLLDEVQKICSHVCVLKNGTKLYEGHVQSLLAGSEGIEVASDDLEKLRGAIESFEGVDTMEQRKDAFLVQLKDGYRSSELSAYLIKKGVDITLFAHRKGNLENEFLQLLSGDVH